MSFRYKFVLLPAWWDRKQLFPVLCGVFQREETSAWLCKYNFAFRIFPMGGSGWQPAAVCRRCFRHCHRLESAQRWLMEATAGENGSVPPDRLCALASGVNVARIFRIHPKKLTNSSWSITKSKSPLLYFRSSGVFSFCFVDLFVASCLLYSSFFLA